MKILVIAINLLFIIGCGGGSSEKDSDLNDLTAPIITIKGSNPFFIEYGSTYKDLGATANDNIDGVINVQQSGDIDTNKLETYTITYIAKDYSGNKSTAKRVVKVIDSIKPNIKINGEKIITILQNGTYQDLGATATDNVDGKINVQKSGLVDTSQIATYTLTYTATDSSGNKTTETRTINVISRVVGSIDTLRFANDIILSKDEKIAYLATYDNGLQIVDITNPKKPILLSSVATPSNALKLVLSPDNTKIYISDDNDLQIVNINNPRSPTIIGSLTISGNAYGVAFPNNQERAYVTTNLDGLQIVDIIDISKPIVLSQVNSHGLLQKMFFSPDSNKVFMTDTYNSAEIINISDSKNPLIIGNIATQGKINGLAFSSDTNVTYIIEDNKLQIINISNPKSPILLGSMFIPGTANFITISKDKKIAYIASSYDGIQVIDISNPKELKTIQKILTPGFSKSVAISSDNKFAYVADWASGLQIIDLPAF